MLDSKGNNVLSINPDEIEYTPKLYTLGGYP